MNDPVVIAMFSSFALFLALMAFGVSTKRDGMGCAAMALGMLFGFAYMGLFAVHLVERYARKSEHSIQVLRKNDVILAWPAEAAPTEAKQ